MDIAIGENLQNQSEMILAQTMNFAEIGVEYGLKLGTVIILVIGGFYLSSFISNMIRTKLSTVRGMDKNLIPVISQCCRYVILVIVGILVMSQLGIETTSLIAILGAAGLAVGLALQGTLQNVAAGVMLLFLRPLEVGDYIEAGNIKGTVDEIGLFMTRLHTPEGIFVAAPNGQLWSATLYNYSKLPKRRLDIQVGISYDDDIDKAKTVLQGIIDNEERFIDKDKSRVLVKALGDSSVNLEMRAWVDRLEYWDLRSKMIETVKVAFDNADINIPYPHRQIITEQIAATPKPSNGRRGAREQNLTGKKAA